MEIQSASGEMCTNMITMKSSQDLIRSLLFVIKQHAE